MIYTQQRTIIDANRLINQYFRVSSLYLSESLMFIKNKIKLPNESVNNIHIYSPYSTSISSPYVKIFTNNGDSSYTLGNYTNDPDCWPLSVQNAQSMNLRDFFNNLKRYIAPNVSSLPTSIHLLTSLIIPVHTECRLIFMYNHMVPVKSIVIGKFVTTGNGL